MPLRAFPWRPPSNSCNDMAEHMQSSSEFEAARTLREGRAAAGLEIEAVSQLTRIPQDQIRALEEGRYGDLPGSAYARAFARTLSNTYGIDPDAVVAALRRDLREPAEPAIVAPEPASNARMQSTSIVDEPAKTKSGGPFVLLGVLALAFLVLIGLTRLKDFSPAAPPAPMVATDSVPDTVAALHRDTVPPPPAPVALPRTVSITARDSGHSVFLLYIKAGRVRKWTLNADSLVLDPDTTALFRNLSSFTLRLSGAVSRDSFPDKYFRLERRDDTVRVLPADETEWKTMYDKIMERRKERTRRDSN